MGLVFAFDPDVVAKRSLVSGWIQDCAHRIQCDTVLAARRAELEKQGKILALSELPSHASVLERRFSKRTQTRDIVVESDAKSKYPGSTWPMVALVCLALALIAADWTRLYY